MKRHTPRIPSRHHEAAPLVSRAAVLSSEAKVSLKASPSISIKKRLHRRQCGSMFLIPAVRPPRLPLPPPPPPSVRTCTSLHPSSPLPPHSSSSLSSSCFFPLILRKLLMQGKPALRRCNYGLAACSGLHPGAKPVQFASGKKKTKQNKKINK